MNIPGELLYTSSHEWVRKEAEGIFVVGITDHAQEVLGDLVFVELPALHKQVKAGEECAVVESVKAASDVYAPISGEVIAINESVTAQPDVINHNAYESWMFKIKSSDSSEIQKLLDAQAYHAVVDEGH